MTFDHKLVFPSKTADPAKTLFCFPLMDLIRGLRGLVAATLICVAKVGAIFVLVF